MNERAIASRRDTPLPGLSDRALALLVFAAGVIAFGLVPIPRDFYGLESRFVLFARDMLEHGLGLFPRVYGRPYADYPPLGTWLITLVSWPLGRVTVTSAILPSALAASLSLVLLLRVGMRISRRHGLLACAFAGMTFLFVQEARTTSMDTGVLLATLVTYLAWCRDEGSPRWLLGILGLAFGLAMRGPLGAALPAAVVGASLAVSRQGRRLVAFGLTAAGVAGAGFGLQLAAAAASGGESLARLVFQHQFAARMGGRAEPWWYYPSRGLASYAPSFPAAVAWIAASLLDARVARRDRGGLARPAESGGERAGERGGERAAGGAAGNPSGEGRPWAGHPEVLRWIVWAGAVLVLLSIPAAKKARYALAMTPAVSLLAAGILADPPSGAWSRRLRVLVLGILRLLPLAGLAMALAGAALSPWIPELGVAASIPAGVLFGLLAAIVGWPGGSRFAERKGEADRRKEGVGGHDALAAALAGAVSVLILLTLLVEPILAAHNRTEPFLRRVEAARGEEGRLAFFRVGPDSIDLTYVANASRWIEPRFVQDPRDLVPSDPPTVYVTTEERFAEAVSERAFSCDVVARGSIGHHACVAFLPGDAAPRPPSPPRVP